MEVRIHPIETYIINQLENHQIPDISNIGGLDAVYQHRKELSISPIADEILRAVISGTDDQDQQQNKMISDLFSEVFLHNQDPIAVREVLRLLAANADCLKKCFSTLLELAGDATRAGILRRYYLAAVFEIALNDPAKKHRLIGYLLEADGSEDPEYLNHLIKIIGLSFTYFDQQDLFTKLESLENCANEERYFELGMGWLHNGLNAVDREESTTCFKNAFEQFTLAIDYGREDARNYTFVLDLLDKFTKRAPASEIQPLINSFKNGVMIYSAWNPSDTALSWAGLRNTELMNWNLLAEKLGTLTVNLNELSWFEPRMVIEEYLLKIYSSSRSILNKKHGHGVDQLIQPVIRERMADQHSQVYLLEEWLKKKPKHELWPIAQELKLQIASFKATQPSGNEQGTTILSNVVPAVAKLDGKEKTEFQNFITAYIQTNAASTSKVITSTFEQLCDQLTQVPSFCDPEVKLSFQTILYQSLVFLKLRMDHTKKNHPGMEYLFKSSKHPLESALQEDYYTYMSGQPSIGDLHTETMDVASGRADVSFNFGSYRIFTEVKREMDDCSFDNLCKLYLGQVMEYGNTSAKLGILLVLDLTDKSHGIGSFESQIRLQISPTASDQEKRGVVIIKMPGNRLTPSSVKSRTMSPK